MADPFRQKKCHHAINQSKPTVTTALLAVVACRVRCVSSPLFIALIAMDFFSSAAVGAALEEDDDDLDLLLEGGGGFEGVTSAGFKAVPATVPAPVRGAPVAAPSVNSAFFAVNQACESA